VSIASLGVFEIILIGLVFLVIAIMLMYLAGDRYADEKTPWWSRWTRLK